MKYLLDTCVLLWAIQGDRKRLGAFSAKIESPDTVIAASVVSYWEIVIKCSLKKLTIPEDFIDLVEQSGFSWLTLELHHIQQLKQLPLLHQDPFDRLLISQAMADQFELLTSDQQILKYW